MAKNGRYFPVKQPLFVSSNYKLIEQIINCISADPKYGFVQ